ncbi:MAG: FKBP-type peptidyl-prolyl cis-trans isomerase [Bacteroidetes bacterium]|nr:FKBP-type peptidyl-prolyl cis-trans isomerase [Bacteroidota bacterium]
MNVSENKVVQLIYELRKSDAKGKIVEKIEELSPLTFLYGTGSMLKAFEANLNGLEVDAEFEFILKTDEAYGAPKDENIMEMPKDNFIKEGQLQEDLLKIDNYIALQDENGHSFNARVLEVNKKTVKMDFNHPLAGKDLHFKGKVTNIREASEEEKSHGHAHGPGGHDH